MLRSRHFDRNTGESSGQSHRDAAGQYRKTNREVPRRAREDRQGQRAEQARRDSRHAQADLGMGHGDANTLVHVVLKSDGASAAEAAGKGPADVLDEIYSGAKARAPADSRQADDGDRQVRPLRDRAQEGLRQPPPQEAVRHDRSGHQHARRGRPQHEGCGRRPRGSKRCRPAACVSTR